MFLLHPPIEPWARADEQGLELVLLADAALPDGRVFVRCLPDNEELLVPMAPDGRQGALHRFRARIAWNGGDGLTLYAFVAAGDDALHWLGADGPHPQVPPEALHFRVHRHERPPAWVREQVFYQVFPDRFARDDTVPATVPLKPWGALPDPQRGEHEYFGGNLAGVAAKLPYLADELGVTGLYLNPVFEARSSHRYDTADYTRVDPLLGGNAALQALREATRERGMRLVLDAVVNHTGAHHAWLQQQPELYARDAQGRPLGWKGHDSLPVLDFAQPAVQQAVYGGEQAVLRHWLRPPWSIDGWRLDVIHMLGEGPGAANNAAHVRAIRRAIKAENPEAYVLGEHFSEATRWLQGEQEDGAMNYHGFAAPLQGWLAGQQAGGLRHRLATADFERWMTRAAAAIPHANQLAQLNLLDSHDTPRLLTVLGGDLALLQLAMTLLFTRPGVPGLYYGDEIGLEGGADPDCRRCFDWNRERWPEALWQHVRELSRLRRSRAEWRHGATLTLAMGEDWLVFARYTAGSATLVGANRGAMPRQVAVPLARLPLALGESAEMPMPARGAVLRHFGNGEK